MKRPLVSIVIATFNSRRDHLSAAITSALAQSWREIEIIVSDDSQRDELQEFVASFRDARLRYRHNSPALGVAGNHWAAFAEARGEYIAVLNHDDWIAPTFVERLALGLNEQPEATLAFCDHWVIDVRGRKLEAESDRNSLAWGRATLAAGMHRPFVHLIANQTIPMAMGAMFRRAALPSATPVDAGPAYDLWLAYLLCCGGGGAWYVAERLSAWRTHATSLTSEGGLAWLQGSALCWSTMAGDTRFGAVRHLASSKAALSYYACAVREWTHGHRIRCIRFALRSLRASVTRRGLAAIVLPFVPVAWLRQPLGRSATGVARP